MKKTFTAVGVMSGTSGDGLDLALCNFEFDEIWKYEILKTDCIPYHESELKRLSFSAGLSAVDFLETHTWFGFYIGEKVKEFIAFYDGKIDCIASHGHTFYHSPEKKMSVQLGSGAAIAASTGTDCISDFRSTDVALGGQGAPLVPIGDELLFGEYDFCLNLGGIANFSFKNKNGNRCAWDISYCNLLLNYVASLAGKNFDENGNMAAAGKVNDELLYKFSLWNYYQKNPPKSLEKKEVLDFFLPLLEASSLSPEDKLATLVADISVQINRHIIQQKTKGSKPEILVTGGGSFNKILIKKLSENLQAEYVIPSAELISFKEALVFAFLGVLRILREDNAISSVTGAAKNSCSGAWYKA